MELYKEYRKLGGLYAACAATCLETYHHWRVFTSAADGACVEIYQAPLERALSSIEGVRFGRVQYLRLEDVERLTKRDAANLPFFKRIAFMPEQEYRIVIETTEPQSPAIALELPIEWIGRIVLNPWLPERVARSVIATLKELAGSDDFPVERSHMIENARWKRAGNNIADGALRRTDVRNRRKF